MIIYYRYWDYMLKIALISMIIAGQPLSAMVAGNRILPLTDNVLKSFSKDQGFNIETQWEKMVRTFSYEEQDFQNARSLLLPAFYVRLAAFNSAFCALFEKLADQPKAEKACMD